MNEDAPYFSGTWEIDELIQKRISCLILNINKLTSLLWRDLSTRKCTEKIMQRFAQNLHVMILYATITYSFNKHLFSA